MRMREFWELVEDGLFILFMVVAQRWRIATMRKQEIGGTYLLDFDIGDGTYDCFSTAIWMTLTSR